MDAETKELKKTIKKRLIETGEWDRIALIFQAKLTESGWADDMAGRAQELARQQTTLNCNAIMSGLAPHAEASVPSQVKEDIVSLIQAFIEENAEK